MPDAVSGEPDASGREDRRSTRWGPFREERRREIAMAIVRRISAGSRETLTVAELVGAAGISRKTFYKYFDSLGEAMVYAQQLVVAELRAGIDRPGADGSSGLERFLRTFEDLGRFATRRPELVRFNSYFDFTFCEQLGQSDEREVDARTMKGVRALEETFRAGQADGSIRSDLDARTVILTLGNAAVGLVQRALLDDRSGELPRVDPGSLLAFELDVWRRFPAPPRDSVGMPSPQGSRRCTRRQS